MQKEDIPKKFKKLFEVLSSEEFLEMKALGGEIPFFVSAYNPEQHLEVAKAVEGIQKKLKNKGIRVLELNLYDLILELVDRELGLETTFELEKELGQEEFKEALQAALDIEEVFMPEISQRIEDHKAQIYFLTGIGLSFPILRSHNILNNLQSVATEAPTVAFFPGRYNGQSLELFGRLKDDNYYRAFNIENYQHTS